MKKQTLFVNRSVAQTLRQAIDHCNKTQKEIAKAVGFPKPNILTMLKNGSTPLPINRVGPLAKAVGLDPAFLLRRVMQEYYPDTWSTIEENLGNPILTARERYLIQELRCLTENTDPDIAILKHPESTEKLGLLIVLDLNPDAEKS